MEGGGAGDALGRRGGFVCGGDIVGFLKGGDEMRNQGMVWVRDFFFLWNPVSFFHTLSFHLRFSLTFFLCVFFFSLLFF